MDDLMQHKHIPKLCNWIVFIGPIVRVLLKKKWEEYLHNMKQKVQGRPYYQEHAI
jgi:hypothetical protein